MTKRVLLFATILGLATARRAQAQQPTDGSSIYAKSCASCHGAKGTPNPATARAMRLPDFAAASMTAVSDSVLRDAILNGRGRTMPAYKARFSAEQVAALIAYIRTLRGR